MSDPPPLLPPPAPPLPPNRPTGARSNVLQRLVGPLGFGIGGSRPPSAQAHLTSEGDVRPGPVRIHSYAPVPSQTASHKTGIPIASLDINQDKTHAILAGKEILKTVRIEDGKVTEEFNLRSAISSYASAHSSANTESRAAKRRDFLPASDVKWSHGNYSTIIATAANYGRIALYDLRRPEVENAWLHEHTRSVHKLAFNPHQGYYLLSGSHDGSCRAWDLRSLAGERAAMTTKSFRQFQGRTEAVRDVRWSPTDAVDFVMGTDSGTVMLWDMRNASAPKLRLNGHEKACSSVDWHPDGKHVVSAGLDKFIKVFNVHRDDRRQKPAFHIRTSQAVMNVRWRPACWSSELQGIGHWQSTQLVATYNQDPRIHVWDLRRPYIPFRELDRYNNPATDILWASKDLLWTVGNEGMFTQTDVTFAPQVHQEIAPCSMDWFPNGEYGVFTEERGIRRGSELEDPAAGFLNVRHEKLSSGEVAAMTPNISDDEGDHDGFFSNSFRRRQSKGASSRSIKSRTNSPPYKDDLPMALPLDKALFEKKGLFNNGQAGFIGEMEGAAMEPAVVQFLAERYARAPTEAERNQNPETILDRLQDAFRINADISDYVAMYRLGQSWRILSAVLIPELRDWADHNRQNRLVKAKEVARIKLQPTKQNGIYMNQKTHPDEKVEKRLSGLIRSDPLTATNSTSALRSLRLVGDPDSTSNVTTPLARPLSDSIHSNSQQSTLKHLDLDEEFDTIPELPPSVVSSHSTAAAASNALRDDASQVADTPPSSPEAHRSGDSPLRIHRRTHTTDSVPTSNSWLQPPKSAPQAIQGRSPSRRSDYISPKQQLKEDDRRAALRDYQVQTRPLLTLPDPLREESISRPFNNYRHDSNESFAMFSASTDSSHRAKSFGTSFESPESRNKTSVTPEDWHDRKDSFEPSSPPSNESGQKSNLSEQFSTSKSDPTFEVTFPMDGSTTPDLGLNVQATSRLKSEAWSTSSESHKASLHRYADPQLSISSTPEEPFHFEVPDRKTQPVRNLQTLKFRKTQTAVTPAGTLPSKGPAQLSEEALDDSPTYIASDFRPIDPSYYSPKYPYAWSALPLIAHAIAFDLESGQACGLFSVHLLLHVYPFFFDQRSHIHCNGSQPCPSSALPHHTVAEKLINPHFNSRVIEAIFTSHFLFLKKMRLYVPMAELRTLCHEFGLKNVFKSAMSNDLSMNSDDQYLLSITCIRCRTPMQNGSTFCQRCKKVRDACPVCLCVRYVSDEHHGSECRNGAGDKAMWAFCQSCGHSAHMGCMEEWLSHEYSEGRCPTSGCGCDCAPGVARKERIRKQMHEEEDAKLITGKGVSGRSGSPRVKDEKEGSKRIGESRAVERTRRVLRESGTQSGDEMLISRRESRGSAGGPSQGPSLRKTVRVMTPGEESSRKESR
jgi:WD repeat-containing protein 24